jgi:hemin uptake protein HemP
MKFETSSSKAMSATKPIAPSATRALNSHTLLGGQDEIAIRHGNETYRLRRTRQGKLILTK